AVLEIRAHRQRRRLRDLCAVGEELVAADSAGAVDLAERVGEAEARRRERLEAERRQQLRGAGVPGVGDDEYARALVQRAECGGLVLLSFHGRRSRPLMIFRVGVSGISGITTRRSGSLFFAMSF